MKYHIETEYLTKREKPTAVITLYLPTELTRPYYLYDRIVPARGRLFLLFDEVVNHVWGKPVEKVLDARSVNRARSLYVSRDTWTELEDCVDGVKKDIHNAIADILASKSDGTKPDNTMESFHL